VILEVVDHTLLEASKFGESGDALFHGEVVIQEVRGLHLLQEGLFQLLTILLDPELGIAGGRRIRLLRHR